MVRRCPLKRLTILCLCLALFVGGAVLPSVVFGYAESDEYGMRSGPGIP